MGRMQEIRAQNAENFRKAQAAKAAKAAASTAPTGKKKSITTKYGTRIDVTGLDPERIEKVRAMAEDNGAYGAKGAALAKQFQKRLANKAGASGGNEATGTVTETETTDSSGEFDIDINTKRDGALFEDFSDTFNTIPQVNVGTEELERSRDADYRYRTADYGKSKAQELEEKKQELAERGIPLDPSPDSLYGRSIAEIERKYEKLDKEARDASIATGAGTYGAVVGAEATASNAFLTALLGLTDAELNKLNISTNAKLKLKEIATAERARGGSSGGSSGGGDSQSPIIGGTAPGFNI